MGLRATAVLRPRSRQIGRDGIPDLHGLDALQMEGAAFVRPLVPVPGIQLIERVRQAGRRWDDRGRPAQVSGRDRNQSGH